MDDILKSRRVVSDVNNSLEIHYLGGQFTVDAVFYPRYTGVTVRSWAGFKLRINLNHETNEIGIEGNVYVKDTRTPIHWSTNLGSSKNDGIPSVVLMEAFLLAFEGRYDSAQDPEYVEDEDNV